MKVTIPKKVFMSSVAVALTLSAGTIIAFAATSQGSSAITNSTGSPTAKSDHFKMGMMKNNMISDLASDLHLSTSALQADFQGGKTVSELASEQGVPTSTLISELETSMASQQMSHIDTQVTNFVNGIMPKWNGHRPGQSGDKGPGKTGHRITGHRIAGHGNMMSALASDLHLSRATLQSDLKAGKTVAQIASAQNVPTSTLISELEASMTSQMTSNIDTKITHFVNRTTPPQLGNRHGWMGNGANIQMGQPSSASSNS